MRALAHPLGWPRPGTGRRRPSAIPLAAILLVVMTVGCARGALLEDVSLSRPEIRPNGQSIDQEARLAFRLTRRADVTVALLAPDGTRYVLRDGVTRVADAYEVALDGAVRVDDDTRRVLPNGDYKIILAAAADGRADSVELSLRISDADTVPLAVLDLAVSRVSFTPNGDGNEDDVRISYRLTKDAEVTVSVRNEFAGHHVIDPPTRRNASLLSHLWDGTTGGRILGGKLLPNGRYAIQVDAKDRSGNTSRATTRVTVDDGGTPRLEITDVRFTPPAVPISGTLNVRITVKNAGDTHIKTQGPPSGTPYTTTQTYASFRRTDGPDEPLYFEKPGYFRVGVTWDNAPQEFPLRWGFFATKDENENRTLAPGEEVTIEGKVVVLQRGVPTMRFWAGVIQEGVGYPGGRVGQTVVTISQ